MPVVAGTTGRAVTPRDLLALRSFFEECACLSAGAALLAVLVARIGELERIVIHPADLIEDLGRRLHWRDVPPGELYPQRVGAWLRSLGFSPAGRDRLGATYEIRWDELWALDPRTVSAPGKGLDLFALDGAELLRMLAEEQGLFFAPRIWCPECDGVVATLWADAAEWRDEPWPCVECGGPTRLLGHTWLGWASARMREAIRNDPNLLPAVKAKWEALHDGAPFPRVREPLGWLNTAWERAGKPRGRPGAVLHRYLLAHAVDWLERAGVSKPEIESLFAAHGKPRQALYNNLSGGVQRFLECGKAQVLDAPSVNPRTLWASVQWARRQWTNPVVRLQGEGPFPSIVRQKVKVEASTGSGHLDSSEPALNIPVACPRCATRPLARIVEDRLPWVQCWKCGWRLLVSQ